MQNPTYNSITAFPGYRVGSDGSVWRLWVTCRSGRKLGSTWRQMKLSPTTKGYLRVNLTPPSGGPYTTLAVHRLVLESFVGPCPEGMECRHLNGIKTDCRLDNLCWGTPEQNRDDICRHGTRPKGESHPLAILTDCQVQEIRTAYASGTVLQKDLAEQYQVSVPTISMIVNRRIWTHVS